MQKLMNGELIIATAREFNWVPEQYGWSSGDIIYADPEKQYHIEYPPPKVGPIHFQMLFQPAEMVTAEQLKATDKVLASFWKLIDDPRTDTIDLNLATVQNAIEYTLTVVKGAGVVLDVQQRKAEILTGELK
jgi:hypothetical protein